MTRKVLLVGWDAADWRVIHPLLDAGRMPGLQSIVEQGVMANLATLYPPLSPMMWTSIATGKRPFKHGILGFTEPSADGTAVQPVSVLSRRGKALWNVLMQNGYRSNVIGWWPSHPAEPVDGVMVSNHYQQAIGPSSEPWPMAPGTVHPARLRQALAALRFHPDELGAEHILPFIPRAAEIDQDTDRRLASCAKILSECTSIHAAATHLMAEEPWDLMAVYYDAIDHFSHAFMRYHPPRRDFIPERDYALYHNVVTAAYLYHDMMLQRLLGLAGDETTVILVSDHGFHPDHLRPRSIPHEPAGPAVEHRDFGVLAMKGPGIKRDQRIYGASLLDVTPTVLALFDLAVGDDMDGKPLVEAFIEPPAVERIPSWDDIPGNDGQHPPERRTDPFEGKAALEQLIALGYVEEPGADEGKAVARTVRELDYNLARSYMDAGLHADAARLLEGLYEREPDQHRLGLHLAMCYRALGRIAALAALVSGMKRAREREAEQARGELDRVREIAHQRAREHAEGEPAQEGTVGMAALFSAEELARIKALRATASFDVAALDFLDGCVHVAEGNLAAAVSSLKSAEQAAPERLALHLHLGEAYLQMKSWEEATQSFEHALGIDPENPFAHLGMARACLIRRRARAAAAHALDAISLQYFLPLAHYCLGVALHRIGKLDRAVQALHIAITQNPNFAEAHERLAYIHERRLHDPDRAARHRRLAREIRAHLSSAATASTALPVLAEPEDTFEWRAQAAPEPSGAGARARQSARLGNTPPSAVQEHDISAEPVTIVSGLPRSGTSMMMQMLAAAGLPVLADEQRGADEDNPRGYFECEGIKRLRSDPDCILLAPGKAVKVIAQLVALLPVGPRYRAVLMERDTCEVIASQRRMLERAGRGGSRLDDEQLARIFKRQVEQARRVLNAHSIPLLSISYAETVRVPRATARRLNVFLGGALDEAAMAGSVDPALHRQKGVAGVQAERP